jgi:hypothetical protein
MKPAFFSRFLIVVLSLLASCSPSPLQVTPPVDMSVVEGKLLNQIARLEKNMPRADSEGFIVPTDEQKQVFSKIVTDLRTGNLQNALVAASAVEYELLWYIDQNDDNAVDYVLRENNSSKNGWGLYVFRAATNSPIIIEAPHPIYDAGTPTLAADLFRALDAQALLVAGTHRDANRDGSADVSAKPQSIFQAVHESELQHSIASMGSGIVLQIHGFSASKHPAYPHVIISYEHGKDINPVDLVKGQQLANRIADALVDKRIKTGLCGGDDWRDLCGTTNVQATLMTQGIFIHIELDETIRENEKKFIKTLVEVFGN